MNRYRHGLVYLSVYAACFWILSLPTFAAEEAKEYIKKGHEARQSGQYQKALEFYQKATEQKAPSAEAHQGMGEVYKLLGQYEKAIEALKKAAEINPNDPMIYTELGDVYEIQESWDSVIWAFEKVRHLDPKQEQAYEHLANAYSMKRMYSKAIETYRAALPKGMDGPFFRDGRDGQSPPGA